MAAITAWFCPACGAKHNAPQVAIGTPTKDGDAWVYEVVVRVCTCPGFPHRACFELPLTGEEHLAELAKQGGQ